ncbi:MAG TPA: RagB/SusD family nutrient uptake outer membrane protein [Balneolaceae bacterium]|nr:RagB/SusD family nutrient uptake outer membrane protein [Balneolaceae bacterium]
MRSLKYITVFVIMLFAWGCKNILDTQPQQSISENTALDNSDNVKSVLMGAYDNLGEYDEYGGQFYMLPDLMAVGQEANWSGTYEQPGEIYRKNINVDNSFVRDGWLYGYTTINDANNVLAALDKVDSGDQDKVEGEAKFLRGITYFQLVRLFAKDYSDGDPSQNLGVPITLKPTRTIDESANIPRNTVQEVYDQVISDLSDAKSKLAEHDPSYVYADTYAASAFLARVYLQMDDYTKARDEANRVITQGPYSLVSNYADAFNHSNVNTSEDIFATQVTNQDGTNSLQIFYASQDNGGRGDIEIQQSHLDLYGPNDDRLAFFYDDGGEWRTGKWKNQYGNVNVIRLAEMYLIRAECNERLGETVGATPTEDINTIRSRSNASTYAAGTVTLNDILAERHIELAFEGHFLFDVKRTHGDIGGLPWNSTRLVYPIPQREMDANPQLVQNDGYGS